MAEAESRSRTAYRLRHEKGLSFPEIGRRLGGVTGEAARQSVRRAETAVRRARDAEAGGLQALSRRTELALARAKIRTVAELLVLSDDELLSLPRFGRGSLAEVRAAFGPGRPVDG